VLSPLRPQAAKDQIGEMHLERIRVIGSSEFSQVLSSDVKMVYFCGPSLGKAGMVRALLAAHKSVMCDKPLSPSVAETKELFSAARATGKVLMINLPGRPGKAFAPTVMSLLSSASRTVSSPLSSRTNWARRPHHPVLIGHDTRVRGSGGGARGQLFLHPRAPEAHRPAGHARPARNGAAL
jgi:predicted dehydrogenase